jgi:hypothetical protein
MTIVKEENYLAERFVYLVLKNKHLSYIENELKGFGPKQVLLKYFDSLKSESKPFQTVLFNNSISDPQFNKQTAHFDLEDNKLGINVKYLFDSSANSRIRDLTKELVIDLELLLVNTGLIQRNDILDYNKLRNGVFQKISENVKNKTKTNLTKNEDLHIKLCYLICLNLITHTYKSRNIFFVKFHSNGNVNLFHAYSPTRKIDLEYFLSHVEISFSKNIPNDPHKKTIQFNFVINSIHHPIGFFEVRSNGRVMLHLRESESHWFNLKSKIKYVV